jgi:hypothetical protein
MTIALLFLILFAILFPRSLRFLFALLFIGGIVALSEAHAYPSVQEAEQWCFNHPESDSRYDHDEHLVSVHECAIRLIDKYASLPHQDYDYYTPGQMYSGPLGAHTLPGPHLMAPYTGW